MEALCVLVNPPPVSRAPGWHGQAAGRRLVQTVAASRSTSASDCQLVQGVAACLPPEDGFLAA
jgi:hypothetical protein